MGVRDRLGLVLTLALAVTLAPGSVAWAGSRCQIVPATDARLRLDIWGRELAGAKGAVAAHSARRVAWVADRQGVVIEALFLVTLQEAGAPGQRSGPALRAARSGCAARGRKPIHGAET